MEDLKVGNTVRYIKDENAKYLYNETKIQKGRIIKITGLFKNKYLIEKKALEGFKLTDVCILVSRKNILQKLEETNG